MLNLVATCSLCGNSVSLDTYKAFAQSWRKKRGAENYRRTSNQLMRQTSGVKYNVPQAQIQHTPYSEVITSLVSFQKIAMGSTGKQQKCSWR